MILARLRDGAMYLRIYPPPCKPQHVKQSTMFEDELQAVLYRVAPEYVEDVFRCRM